MNRFLRLRKFYDWFNNCSDMDSTFFVRVSNLEQMKCTKELEI